MTNEETIAYFKECNERLVSVAKYENVYDYEKQVIEAVCMKETFDANEMAIQALEQQPIIWIVGKDNCQVTVRNMPIDKMQKICAIIGEIEQQPCEDCISKAEMEKIVGSEFVDLQDGTEEWRNIVNDICLEILDKMKALPSVTPKFTDEEIQKMQELEQAQLEKAYELGKAEMQTSFEDWLSTFNTESAPQCFNAVQELKKQIEKKQNT